MGHTKKQKNKENTLFNVEWCIGSRHDSGARGLGFDFHPNPGWHFNRKTLISLLSDSRLKKTADFIYNIMMSS
jgi:hypothetical protein